MWVAEMELRSSGLVAGPFSHWAIPLAHLPPTPYFLINSLRIFTYSPLPSFSQIQPPLQVPYLANLVNFFFFFFKPIKYKLCCPQTPGCEAFQWSMVYLPGAMSLKKTDSPPRSHQLPIAPQLEVGRRAASPLHAGLLSGLCMLPHGCDFVRTVALLCLANRFLVVTRCLRLSYSSRPLSGSRVWEGRGIQASH